MTKPIRPIRIEGDVAYVTLTHGYEAIIDAADVSLVEGVNWMAIVRHWTVYVHGRLNGKRRSLHRVLANPDDGAEVDHVNGDGLDNRRANLRAATRAQNCQNRRRRKDNTSGFKGVRLDRRYNKWRAEISACGSKYDLGCFDTPEAAHAAYVAASEVLHGEFARAA